MEVNEDEMKNALTPETLEEIKKVKDSVPEMFVSGWTDLDSESEVDDKKPESLPEQLLWASQRGELSCVQAILTEDPKMAQTVKDEDGYTPLHRAAYNDHCQIIQELVKSGADCRAKTNDGWQPIHSASRWGNLKAAQALLSHGDVDVNARTNGNLTPLHLAVTCQEKDPLPLIKLLLTHPDIDTTVRCGAGETASDLARRTAGDIWEAFQARK